MTLAITRQFDIPLSTGFNFIIPDNVAGRLTAEDYITFDILDIDKRKYSVVTESYNGTLLRVCPLEEKIRLPFTRFSPDALLLIVPDNATLPVFYGVVKRGRHYIISTFNTRYKNGYLLR